MTQDRGMQAREATFADEPQAMLDVGEIQLGDDAGSGAGDEDGVAVLRISRQIDDRLNGPGIVGAPVALSAEAHDIEDAGRRGRSRTRCRLRMNVAGAGNAKRK